MTRDDGYTRYTMRIPTPLYERVKQEAGEASVNSLVVKILEEHFPPPDPFDDYAARVARSQEILAEMDKVIAGYKDPAQKSEDLAARFQALKSEHEKLFGPTPTDD